MWKPHQTVDCIYLMTISTWSPCPNDSKPPRTQGLIMFTPAPPPCHLTISRWEPCMSWSCTLPPLSLTWPLKMPADPVQRVHGFRAWATCSFIGMCMLACLVAKSCPNLCELMDCCPPGSSVHGILQARILECVAISSSTGSSWLRDRTLVSCVFCIDRQILYHWALRGAPLALAPLQNRLYFPSHKPWACSWAPLCTGNRTQVWFRNNCPCDTDTVWGSWGQFSSRCLASRTLPDLDRSETPSPVIYILK